MPFPILDDHLLDHGALRLAVMIGQRRPDGRIAHAASPRKSTAAAHASEILRDPGVTSRARIATAAPTFDQAA